MWRQIKLSFPYRKKRIEEQKSVVRYDAKNSIAYVIIGLPEDDQHFFYIKVDKIGERQMKALPFLFWII
jgi:two-component system sensor histidine kinase RstB